MIISSDMSGTRLGWRAAFRFAAITLVLASISIGFAQSRMTGFSVRVAVPASGITSTFTISGTAPKAVLIRALGPALAGLGVTGTLADPQIVVTNGAGATVASNDNWNGDAAVVAASGRLGSFAITNTGSRDAALVATLPPGTYAATFTGVGATTGVVLLEVNDADVVSGSSSVFSFLALRGPVGGNAGPLVFGINTSGNLAVMIRALGPTLTSLGVAGALADPTLTVAAGSASFSNNNWGGDATLSAAATQVGATALPANSLDSALFAAVGVAGVSATVTGVGNTTGIAQVEFYSVTSVSIAPLITSAPRDTALVTGSRLTLTAAATGVPAPTYQWQKNGVAIVGATAATYTVAAAQVADAGTYTFVATSTAGTVTSNPAVVSVGALAAPTVVQGPTSQTVTAGAALTLTASVAAFPGPTYQWQKDGVAVPGATNATLTIASVQAVNAGTYTLTATNSQGTITTAGAVVAVEPSSKLSNLSVRTSMADGQSLAVGMVVSGGPRSVLVRAAGPALVPLGFQANSVVANPRMALFNAQSVQILANDDWDARLAPSFAQVAAFPFPAGSRDAAVVQNLDGQVSVQITASGAGTLLAEAYDLETGNSPRLVNLSVLNRVGTGNDVLIAGFNLSGTGTKRLLIRGVGPSLTQLGVTGVLADPQIQIMNSSNAQVGSSDNWDAALAPVMASVGAFPLIAGSRDSALVVTLGVGTYSAIMSGVAGGTGMGIIEVYELP